MRAANVLFILLFTIANVRHTAAVLQWYSYNTIQYLFMYIYSHIRRWTFFLHKISNYSYDTSSILTVSAFQVHRRPNIHLHLEAGAVLYRAS